MVKKRMLVICVDRDNDLYEKAKIAGPIIGRENNLQCATKLVLVDPEETDSNTMFEAIKIYDSLNNENEVEVVTLSGDKRLGYSADKEINEQLEHILTNFPADSCILVSDGASDSEVIPIVQSRIKIESVRTVVMKQAKELEKTYFVILEKLREPYYARIIFGVPAILLLMFALSEYFGYGWKPVVLVIGLYLLIKGFGIEDRILHYFSDFKFSVDKINFLAYLSAVPLIIISLYLGFDTYVKNIDTELNIVKIIALVIRNTLLLLPWAGILILLGKGIDMFRENRKYELVNTGLTAISIILLWLIFTEASDWVLTDTSFREFLLVILGSVAIAFISIEVMKKVRISIASSMKLENKEVLNEMGAYVGKVIGVDRKNGLLVVQTGFGQKVNFAIDSILNIGEKIQIKR
ncbi:DUF373 family protein [Candidatus Micrarchaeota archaeon]|nr:DUF373 family protein [Candidatus Micrarchaeota archaeon]